MRVIIDSNVVVSAVLKNRNPETVVLFVVKHPEFEWVASPEIVEEYISVLRRDKFHLPDEILRRWYEIFESLIMIIAAPGEVDFPRDQKDAKFLACSLAAGASYFITGDKDFEDNYKIGDTTVLSVSLFKRLVCEAWETDAGG